MHPGCQTLQIKATLRQHTPPPPMPVCSLGLQVSVCFFCLFSLRFFQSAGEVFWRPWSALGVVRWWFGSHFCDFLEVSGISENVCFTVVKPYFLRSGGVLVPDFFTLCFCIATFTLFSSELCGFVDPQGVHGVPNVSLCSLWCPPVAHQIGVGTTLELPFGLQGCQMGQNGAKSALGAFKMCQKLTKKQKRTPQKLHACGLNVLRFCTFNVRIHFQSNILIVCTFDS